MTTTVTITHKGPEHHDLDVVVEHGGHQVRHVLKDAESINLYVYRGQSITITEKENNNG